MPNHIQIETVSANLTVRRCLGCGDAGGSNPNASDEQKAEFAGWFRFKHKDCGERIQKASEGAGEAASADTNDDNYLRLVETDETRRTRSNLLRFPARMELPFTATLEIGNMKSLGFPESKSFAAQPEAEAWLESRAAGEMGVTGGYIKNELQRVVYILSNEFYGCGV